MLITRRIGKIVRGKDTPVQVMLTCVLAALLGFVPGFTQAPALVIGLVLLLVILKTNLVLAAATALAAKAISLPLLPVSFAAGRVLLDGPLQGLFKAVINAPLLALCGFEYYAVSGGMVLGALFGTAAGTVVVRGLLALRRKFAEMEETSQRYQKFTASPWTRIATFVFIGGGRGKQSWEELAAKRVGNPVRVPGVVLAVLVIALLVVVQQFARGPIMTWAMQQGLERANGATVDVGSAELDLAAGRLTVERLAMADPAALETDLLRAARVEADVSSADLLRKRVRLDRVVLTDASHGERRRFPGRIVTRAPGKTAEPDERPEPEPGEKTLDDYVEDARQWKERLEQVRRWLEKVSGPGDPDTDDPGRKETLDERIKRRIREVGYARVAASHLIEGAPTVAVSALRAEQMRSTHLPDGETMDLTGENLSSHPRLLAAPPRVAIKSSRGTIDFDVVLGSASADTAAANHVRLKCRGLKTDAIAGSLTRVAGSSPVRGGTLDLDIDGSWGTQGAGFIDFPLRVGLHDATLTVPGAGSTQVSHFSLPLGLRGPLQSPYITLDDEKLVDALLAAGASRIAGRLRGEADKVVGRAAEEAQKQLGKLGGDAGKALGQGAGKDLNEGVGKQVGDGAKGLLDGLLGGKKVEENGNDR